MSKSRRGQSEHRELAAGRGRLGQKQILAFQHRVVAPRLAMEIRMGQILIGRD